MERGELGGSGPRSDPATPARRKRADGARDEPRRDAKDLQPKVALAAAAASGTAGNATHLACNDALGCRPTQQQVL